MLKLSTNLIKQLTFFLNISLIAVLHTAGTYCMVGKQVELFGKGREQEKKQIRTRPPQQFHNKANMPSA